MKQPCFKMYPQNDTCNKMEIIIIKLVTKKLSYALCKTFYLFLESHPCFPLLEPNVYLFCLHFYVLHIFINFFVSKVGVFRG